ncbi:TPA: hypothetical protein QB366_000066 [Pasteurella multocida]|nr:hypothetical protein [Pasteurella multocida]HDR1019216.1 hypothetical protein [Pasteurella multocida]HDR1031529.1 hypothetical protein [Pasteurella multocida]HDR1296891.1 hypothetical protein [Pasteurella multocida]
MSDSTRAQHGFSALKDLDSNDDGVIDKQDTKFSELKLWRDLNQNGISEENELFNLSDFAIKSLHTAYEDRYDEMAGDNVLSQLGKYEKEDGSFGVMADINFSFNPFYSDFAEKLKLTEEQEKIINLRGIGRVRDLREAATLSAELNDLLQQYTIAKTREEQLALLPSILQKWAQTDNKYQSYDLHLEKTVETDAPDAEVIRLTPNQLNALRNAQHDPAVMQRFEDNKSKISTINSLYSMNIAQLYYTTDEDIDYITDKINRIYNNLIQLAYESLLLQTRLKKYVDSVGFLYKDGVLSRDYSYTVQLFNETFAESPSNALTDLSEYIVLLKNPREWYEGLLLLNQYFEAVEKEGLIEDWKANSSTILNKLERKRIFFSKGFSLNGDQGNDKFLSNITNNVNDRTGNDIFFGSLNDDRLYGGEGDDHLYGGLGDDRLYGGEGEDYLEGGVGQDILEGGQGSDTYVFSKGHGQDILKDEANYGARDIDRLIFTDVALNEVKFRQEGEDLVLFGYHKEDSLRLKYFYSDARYKLEHITFADQSFDLASLRQVTLPLFGSAEDDTINDWSGNSRIEAGAGNDVVRGNDGNDILLGGLGDDRLYGGEGEDYLEGGVGQDILEGGQGSDTYVFSKGHGQDIIEDYSFNHFDSDIIRFVDVNIPEKLWFSRRDNNLLITNLDTADTLTVNNWYLSQNYQIERIELSDGRSLGSSQVEKLVSAMAEFDVEHSGDVLSVPQDEMRKYLNTLSVATYYS